MTTDQKSLICRCQDQGEDERRSLNHKLLAPTDLMVGTRSSELTQALYYACASFSLTNDLRRSHSDPVSSTR